MLPIWRCSGIHDELWTKDGELSGKDGELSGKDGELWRKDGDVWRKDGEVWIKDGELSGKDGELWAKDGEVWRKDGEVWAKDGEVSGKDHHLWLKQDYYHTQTTNFNAEYDEYVYVSIHHHNKLDNIHHLIEHKGTLFRALTKDTIHKITNHNINFIT